jgi:imidazolonepropionase-like amidohydrolase
MLRPTALALTLLAVAAGCDRAADPPSSSGAENLVVLTGARLLDGTGGAPLENAVLVIRGDRLESVGAAGAIAIPAGAEVIELTGKTIMPPLVNLHIHLALTRGFEDSAHNFDEANIREKLTQYARYGVLHVVSQGSDQPLVYEIRRRQRDGEFPGALIYTAGRGFGVVGGYPYPQPNITPELDAYRPTSVEEAVAQVRELARHEPDFVKLSVDHRHDTLNRFEPEILRAVIREARNQGLRTVAHVYTLEDAHDVVDAGIHGLVHSVRDRPVDDALIGKMRERDVFTVATLVREEVNFIYGSRTPYLDDPFFTAHHPDRILATLASEEFQAGHRARPDFPEWEPALGTAKQNLRTLYDAGLPIGFGSDSGPSARWEGYFEHREMELMAEAGLPPDEIVQIASRVSAEILGIDPDYGTIEAGKMAEFLVLGADPSRDVSNTKTLEQVWQRGRLIHDHR